MALALDVVGNSFNGENSSTSCCSTISCGAIVNKIAGGLHWGASNIGFPLNMAQTAFTMVPAFAMQAYYRVLRMDSSALTILNMALGPYAMQFFAATQYVMAGSTAVAMVEKFREVMNDDDISLSKTERLVKLLKEETPLLLNLGCNILAGTGALAATHAGVAFVVGGITLTAPMFFTVAFTLATIAAGYSAYMAAPESQARVDNIVNALWSGALTAMMPMVGLGGIHGFGVPHFMSPLGENIVEATTLTGAIVPAVVGTYQAIPQRAKDAVVDVAKYVKSSVANCFGTMFSGCCSGTRDIDSDDRNGLLEEINTHTEYSMVIN